MLPTLALLIAANCPAGPTGHTAPYTQVHREVRYEVREGTARITLVDQLAAPADDHAELSYALDLPADQVVVVDAKIRSSAGELASVQLLPGETGAFDDYTQALREGSSREDAARPWEHTPAPALRVRSTHDDFVVEVAGPCSVRAVTVELELLASSEWAEGKMRLPLPLAPETGTNALSVEVDGRFTVQSQVRGQLPTEDGVLEIELEDPRLRGRWFEAELYAELPVREAGPPITDEDPEGFYGQSWLRARAEIDVPSPMSDDPGPLALAFVVDRSVSAGEAQLAAAVAQVEAILEAAPPGSRYTVVSFARRPEVAVDPFSPRAARARLRALGARGLDNGSALFEALEKARGILADSPAGLTPRLIVLTDDRPLDDAWPDALGRAPLAHVLHLRDHEGWSRVFADEDSRARAPERTGGIRAWLGPKADPELALHLIRPTRIDRPELFAHGAVLDLTADHSWVQAGEDSALPDPLLEGTGVRALVARPSEGLGPRTGARLLGWVWATPLALSLEESARFDAVGAAVATHDALAAELPTEFTVQLAQESGAVTPYTPREAVPEWRQGPPPPGGLSLHACGCGGCGCRGFGTRGFGTVCRCGAARGPLPDGAQLLADWLKRQPGCRAVKGDHLEVTIWDLEVLAVEGADRCRAELLWGLRLDQEQLHEEHHATLFTPRRTWKVPLR